MAAVSAKSRLRTRTKLIYGLGDWGAAAATTARNLFWTFYIVTVLGVNIEQAGLAFLIGRIWDGINDPLVGTLSDRFQSRWGRRRPFMLAGAVPFGLGFFLMFTPPPVEGSLAIAFYYAFIFILYDTAYTIVNAPYAALTSELTDDYDERSSLAGIRMANSIFASLITAGAFALLAQSVFAPMFLTTPVPEGMTILEHDPFAVRRGFMVSAAVWALLIIITPLLVVLFVREPERNIEPDDEPINFVKTFREVMQNKPFRIGATIYLLAFTAVDIITTVYVWFLAFYMGVEGLQQSLVLLATLGVATISMPLTIWMMQRFGKKNTYLGMMSFWAVVMIGLSMLPPGNFTLVLVMAAIAGLGYGAANAIPWAIVADVIEEDEWRTGKRREGIYASYLVTSRKVSTALAIGIIVPQLLSAVGFVEGAVATQPESAVVALRVLMGAVPAVLLILSMVAASRYPLTKEAHAELVRKLEERRAQQASAASA